MIIKTGKINVTILKADIVVSLNSVFRTSNFSFSFFSLTKDLITLTPARFSLITVFTLSIFC